MFGKALLKKRRRSAAGFSLVELSMSLAVSGVILTALLSFTVYAGKSFASLENYTDLEQKSQNALDTMTRNVRQAQRVTNFAERVVGGIKVTNMIMLVDEWGAPLIYNYTNNVLLQTKSGVTTMLLTNVDFLTFNMYQRNTMANTYNQFSASSLSSCKLISVSWICSRRILGSRLNTESVQTAKIVIRKQ